MRICQIAPLIESVPPRGYGGTERVVHWITEELVRRGHEVTLFASNDSVTSADLVPMHTASLRTSQQCRDYVVHHVLLIEQFLRRQSDFDIIHSHIEYLLFPWIRHLGLPAMTTLHNCIDFSDVSALMREFTDVPLVSISNSQRAAHPDLNWIGTVYHGMPRDLFAPNYSPGDYLLFLGRFSAEKQPDIAIKIARESGHRILIAAKLDHTVKRDVSYFQEQVEPLLNEPGVEYLGEVNDEAKKDLLAGAKALLFPIDWNEPFGLVMIEALASGTPVIAYRSGSVPEVIQHAETGFVCDSFNEAVGAVERLERIDRRRCREEFERRFSVEAMVDRYLSLYARFTEVTEIGSYSAIQSAA